MSPPPNDFISPFQLATGDMKGPGPGLLAGAASDYGVKTAEDAPIGPKGEKGIIGQRGPYVSNSIFESNIDSDICLIYHYGNIGTQNTLYFL